MGDPVLAVQAAVRGTSSTATSGVRDAEDGGVVDGTLSEAGVFSAVWPPKPQLLKGIPRCTGPGHLSCFVSLTARPCAILLSRPGQ